MNGLDVALNGVAAVRKGRMTVRMQIHPGSSQGGKRLETQLQFFNCRAPYGFKRTAQRQVIGCMTDYLEIGSLQSGANCFDINYPNVGLRRLQREVHEIKFHLGYPFDLRKDITARMIHCADQHTKTSNFSVSGRKAANQRRESSSRM